MGFLDNIGKSISDASQSAVQKGREMADVAKYNSLISEEEKRAASIFEQLGRKYMEVKGEAPEEIFRDYIDALKVSEEKVQDYRAKLVTLKGLIRCSSCGAEIPAGSVFCAVCGTKVSQTQQAVQNERKCAVCGASIPSGSKFCTSCGQAVEEARNIETGRGDEA
jgi:DNA replicative helicase MCM subunit Mcm2 (Cdc46/Mcm family)